MSFSLRRVVVDGNSQQEESNKNIHVLLNKMNIGTNQRTSTHPLLQCSMEQQIEEHIESLKVYVGMCNNHAITLSTAVAVAAKEQQQQHEADVTHVTMVLMMDMFRHCFGALKDAVEYSKRKKQQQEVLHQLLISSSSSYHHLSSSPSKRTNHADEVIFLKNHLMDGLMDCHAACRHGNAVNEVNVMVGEAIRLALIVLDEQDDEELVTQFQQNLHKEESKEEQKFHLFPCGDDDESDDKKKIHEMTLPQMFQLTIRNMYYCLQQASSLTTTAMDKNEIKEKIEQIDGSMDMD